MIKATIEGLDVTIRGLDSVGLVGREAAFYAIVEVLQKAFQACKDMISETDHTLRDLAVAGHPYSAQHGFEIHDPDEIVHRQSGRYLSALRALSPTGSGGDIIEGSIDMGDDAQMQALDRWIQDGSTKMRERPWMEWIVAHYGDDFADLIVARISEAMREAASGTPYSV